MQTIVFIKIPICFFFQFNWIFFFKTQMFLKKLASHPNRELTLKVFCKTLLLIDFISTFKKSYPYFTINQKI